MKTAITTFETLKPYKHTENIVFDLRDLETSREQMRKYGDTIFPFFGKNENGEDVLISVFDDKIVMETYQENGYIRTNILHEDGTTEELFAKTTPY